MKKTILHFSDIHFGTKHAPDRAEALLDAIRAKQPSIVALSGDLTQRAREIEFQQARALLDRIETPSVVVPGNHDVPLWNVFRRFFAPRKHYQKWISENLSPFYLNDGLAVLGLDTTRSFTIKGGHIESSDLHLVKAHLNSVPKESCKVLVAHHPLSPGSDLNYQPPVAGGKKALKLFIECGVEIVLTGHRHYRHIDNSKNIIPHEGRSVWLIQAGTVASFRGRGSERMKNSFNWIEISDTEIVVTGFVYTEETRTFDPTSEERLPRV